MNEEFYNDDNQNNEKLPLIYSSINNEKENELEKEVFHKHKHIGKHHKTYYEILFVVMPLFCGYASLFALQKSVKNKYGIGDNDSNLSHYFGIAASLVYIGNLIFRLGHNFFFFFVSPRNRVIVSMISMTLSMAIITMIFFILKNPSLFWVFLAYGLGGIGIGTFESNLLSTIIPLGKQTKLWAIIGIPVGINLITVGGFCLLQIGVNAGFIYLSVMFYIILGLFCFLIRIYQDSGISNAVTLNEFIHQLKHWKHWLPHIQWHSLALLIDMFCVSLFSPGVELYIYDHPYVSWFHTILSNNWLFAIYNASFFLGDTLSRRIFYRVKIIFPFFFLIFSIIGIVCGLSNIPELIPICAFLIAFCNGSIYSQANRKIDSSVDEKYSLIAFSFWLFIGDIGSVIGSNTISFLAVAIKKFYHQQ